MNTDLIDALAATPRKVAHLVAEADDARLDQARPGEWSARTVLAHFRDVESLTNTLRTLRMLAEDGPTLANFDEDAWYVNRNRTRDRKEQLLGDFALQRQALLTLLNGLEPASWECVGTHPMRGHFTIRTWVEAIREHDAGHLRQLEEALGETLDDVLQRRFHPKEE